jgi:hypothetical protein
MPRGLALVAVSSMFAAALPAVAGERVAVDLSAMPVGVLSSDFVTGRTGDGSVGDWLVVKDDSAETGKAIAQLNGDRTDYRFPLAVYKPFSGEDVDVSLRFKPVAGAVDEAGGIAVRLKSFGNYYVVRANALEDNVRFYRVVDGRRQQLASANVKVAPKQWHTLSIRAEGDHFTVWFDGKEMFTANDKTFTGDGKVALWTKADSITHFDRIEMRSLR